MEGCVGLSPVRMLEVVAAAVDRSKLTRSSFAILLTFKGIIHINILKLFLKEICGMPSQMCHKVNHLLLYTYHLLLENYLSISVDSYGRSATLAIDFMHF